MSRPNRRPEANAVGPQPGSPRARRRAAASGSASLTAAEVRRRLGVAGVGERRAIEAAARVVEGQRLDAVAAAIWRRRGWVLVACERGVCLVRRPRLVGRAGDEHFDWADLTAVEAGPLRLELTFGDRALSLRLAPEEEADRLRDAALRHLNGDPERVETTASPGQAVPQPPPLVRMPTCDPVSMIVRECSTGAWQFTCGDDTVARLSPGDGRADFTRALGETSGRRLAFWCRRAGSGWIGVVETPGAAEPVASYYPNWLPGGVIAFQQCSYKLRFRYLGAGWRLFDDSGHKLATLRVHASSNGVIEEIHADVHPSLGRGPDLSAHLISHTRDPRGVAVPLLHEPFLSGRAAAAPFALGGLHDGSGGAWATNCRRPSTAQGE